MVRPGGTVVLADHLLNEDPAAAAWSQELERLRDPSHWVSLPLERLRALGATAGLELEREEIVRVVNRPGLTVAQAAQELGMSRATLYRRLAQYRIPHAAR